MSTKASNEIGAHFSGDTQKVCPVNLFTWVPDPYPENTSCEDVNRRTIEIP